MWSGPAVRSTESHSAFRLIQGLGSYVSDISVDRPLWMHVVRSDVAHGTLNGIETEPATDAADVLAVLTASDLESVPRIPIRVSPTARLGARTQPVLAVDRVRYVGEPVAVVLANTPAAAEDAAARVWIDVDPLPSVMSVDSGSSLWSDIEDNTLVEASYSDGDVASVLAESAEVVEVEMFTSRRTAIPIEPRGLIAAWEDGVLHTWGQTKFVHFTARTLAEMFDLHPSQVQCHRVDIGGMFGVRGEFYPEDFLVPWAAKLTGRSVRWEEHRRDHMATINHAGEMYHRIELGVSEEGRLTGLRAEVTQDIGAYPRPIGSRISAIIMEMLPGPYAWDAYEVTYRGVSTSKAPTGTVRGPAALETTFVRERAVDRLARRIGQDPRQLRRRSLIPPTSIPYQRRTGETGHDLLFDSGDFLRVFDETLKRSGYDNWVKERDRRRQAGEYVGVGSGVFLLHSGVGGEETVAVNLDTDGRFLIRTSATEVGQGLEDMARRALSAMLGGVSESGIDVWSGETEAHSGGVGTFASRSTLFVANALADAAGRLRSQAVEKAAALLRCGTEEVVIDADGPSYRGEELKWKEVAPIEVTGRFEATRATFGFGMHLALVSLDPETGNVVPEKMAVAYDCGRALDRPNVVDQIVGAAAMGVGATLHERFVYDLSGNPVSSNLSDYLIPTAADMPLMEVFVFETAPAEGNPLGIKGVGEAGIVGVGAAIANAVADALGPDADDAITMLPLNREAIAFRFRPDWGMV